VPSIPRTRRRCAGGLGRACRLCMTGDDGSRKDKNPGGTSTEPALLVRRLSTSARKASTPRSSMVYLSCACLRLARSLQSRCTVTTGLGNGDYSPSSHISRYPPVRGLRWSEIAQASPALPHARLTRIGIAHHVAVDVAAGRNGIEQCLVDRFQHPLKVRLDHPVKLHGLAGGQPHRAVAVNRGRRGRVQAIASSSARGRRCGPAT
jgi:hypothetical protein